MPSLWVCNCGMKLRLESSSGSQGMQCPECGKLMRRAGKKKAGGNVGTHVTVVCSCGGRFKAKAELAGRRVRCSKCGQAIVVPAAAPAAEPAAETSLLDDPLVTATNGLPASTLAPLGKSSSARSNFNPTTIIAIAASGAAALLLIVLLLVLLDGSPKKITKADPLPPRDEPRYQPESVGAATPAGPRKSNPPTGPHLPLSSEPVNNQPGAAQPGGTQDQPAAVNLPVGPTFETAFDAWMLDGSNGGGVIPVTGERSVVSHYSWMTQLLPHLGHEEVYDKISFDKSWTHKDNVRWATAIIPEFLNPNDSRDRWTGAPMQGVALSHYVGVSGIDDRNEIAATLPRTDPRAGVFGYEDVVKPEDIKDGASNTVSIVGAGELNGPWIAGGGATVRGAREPFFDDLTGFGTKGAKRGTVAHFADGSTRFISGDIDPEVFRALCTVNGGESVQSDQAGERLDFIPTKQKR